jgi:hypothetical protein
MLDIISYLGFGQMWRNCIPSLWGIASSTVLLNDEPGKRIFYCKGVKQDDHLSPMLFLLAMQPLHMLFKKTQDLILRSKFSSTCDTFRVSMYSDNAAVLITPTEKDSSVTEAILQTFADATRLITNMSKTQYFPI